MIILEQNGNGIRERALAQFAARTQRAIRLRGDVSIRITSSRELRKLNRRFRRKNKSTDVLSFPSAVPKVAGDIAIAGDIAAANAAELGHSPEIELKILILHGLLHLAGYDHECDKGKMRALESRLRRQLRLPVGLIERADKQPRAALRGRRR